MEVGIGGVALGVILLRWGILPCLVWHYSVDALYTALLLMRSHNPYFILSGAAERGHHGAARWPWPSSLYLRRGGFDAGRRS